MARTPAADYLVLDIETVPDTQRWAPPEPPAPPAGAAPAPPPPSSRAAFPPNWAQRVVCAGFLLVDHAYRVKDLGVCARPGDTEDAKERALLEQLSTLVRDSRAVLVTFNGRGFDLPVIALRALCHGVVLDWYYRDRNVRARYTQDGHLDLCDWLADHGAARSGSLDALTRLVGLPGKMDIDGSQVDGLYRAGEIAAIERYCMSDVAQTALLFLRFRLLQGLLDRDAYRAAATGILDALAADARVRPVVDATNRAHLLA